MTGCRSSSASPGGGRGSSARARPGRPPPSRDEATLHATNVVGSRRVFEAAAAAGARALVYASSIGAYSPGPDDRPVDESWPTGGTPSSFYSRHKVATERALDALETAHPELRVVRLRPAL